LKLMAALLLAALVIGPLLAETSGPPGTPNYTAESIANAAANVAGFYAPNTFISIYGSNLAFVTVAIGPDDIRAGLLPTALIGGGVRVLLNNLPANMYFISPRQVNVLIPSSLIPGRVTLQLVNDGLAGPAINIMLDPVAPALFEVGGPYVIATHGNGPLVTPEWPATAGEVVVLYATGLGPTLPAAIPNRLPEAAAPLAGIAAFDVWIDGVAVARQNILYAGLTPGFAGLFQINLRLPGGTGVDPEIRVGYTGYVSPPGRHLSFR
jgi:uncharacterized protein (TIGR03437 family)